MGKTIIVKNIKQCEQCEAYKKLGCYLSIYCNNKSQQIDNNKPNTLIYQFIKRWNKNVWL